ncbi:uncharacterized protein [Epargyreus clarus]|uniref:uncharacterized protein n=1 Tax=Epargyreus clarus TaxID=520877 RepID=UPI003C2D0242
MDDLKTEKPESMLFDKCKCCLGDGELKDMWAEYFSGGRKEIYGEMLAECFDLTVKHTIQMDSHLEQICDSCICRLRDALDFKREVIACEQLRYEHLNNGLDIEIKSEATDDDEPLDNVAMEAEGNDIEQYVVDYIEEDGTECSYEVQTFEDVQYLEFDDVDVDVKEDMETSAELTQNSTTNLRHTEFKQDLTKIQKSQIEDEPKRKWPQKRKKHERLKIYKQYTREDMLKALDSVKDNNLSISEAAKKFKIPRKTLTAKLREAEQSDSKEKQDKATRYFNFIDEVKKILTYTNAVPFKTKSARYFCAYCSTDGPYFEEPDDLRVHTRTKHVDDRTRNIELALRPQWQNEVLKMDIDALHCTVCCTILPTWNKMFSHLEDTHNVPLDEAYTRVIPYILKRDLKCALCNDSFPNYHHLDSHMNTHYSSYICQDCGDTFLSSTRMNKHIKVHMTGRHPCEVCGKVFTLEKYKQKHFDHVHKQEHNIKCLYCPEKFYGTFQRHLHVMERHKEKIKVTTCELCGLRFDWKPYYHAHMRRKHNIV